MVEWWGWSCCTGGDGKDKDKYIKSCAVVPVEVDSDSQEAV